jgi:hypothetical protein
LEAIPGKHSVDTLQKTAIQKVPDLRKWIVLQPCA